jgi:DNA invertase Pin-like site-specific DNA recombinase
VKEFWAYCRVSTTKEEQEESLEAQGAWAEQFARDNEAIVRVVREQASAKTTIGRPRFNEMMAELSGLPKAQRPQYLLVTALDRLSRSTRDTLNVIEALRECRVTLYQRGLGPITAEDFPRLAALIGMSLAGEAENYGRSVRMKQSWDKRRAEGKPTSNKVPYGLQLRGGRDIIIAESGAWVSRAFEWYGSGALGMYRIAHRFAEGAPPHTWLTSKIGESGERVPKTRKATKWESNRIRKLLEQKRYRDTIVPAELFDKVQERLAKTPRTGSRRIREYPLGAALVCRGCERHLHGAASGGLQRKELADGTRREYVQKRTRYYECYVCRYRLNADVLEQRFFGDIGDLTADDALLRRWVTAPQIGSRDLAATKRELLKLETEASEEAEHRKRDRIFDLAITANVGDKEVRRQLERVRQEFASKRERAQALQARVAGSLSATRSIDRARELLASFRQLYDRAAYDRKREIVAAVAEALGGVTVSQAGLAWTKRPSVIVQRRHARPNAKVMRPGRRRENQPSRTGPKRRA